MIFLYSSEKKELEKAINWTKQAFRIAPKNKVPECMDTYANLLYKLGQKKKALEIERQAIKVALKEYADILRPNLEKMEKNEPTWNRPLK